MGKQNFPVQHEGKTYWVSRSVAVAGFIFIQRNGETYILANKRGPGTPNYQGFWNAPCGYLDFDETTREGCIREIFEETGIHIDSDKLKFDSISEDPYNTQNITFKYYMCLQLQPGDSLPSFSSKNAEKDEVAETMWINIRTLIRYSWAFNHFSNIIRIYRTKLCLSARIIRFFFPRAFMGKGWPSMIY